MLLPKKVFFAELPRREGDRVLGHSIMRLARTTDLLTSCVAGVSLFSFVFSFFVVDVVCHPPPQERLPIREELKELVDRYPRISGVLLTGATVGSAVRFFRWIWESPHKFADPKIHRLYDSNGDEYMEDQWRALTDAERASWWHIRRQLQRGGEATESERKAFKRCLDLYVSLQGQL